MHTARVTATRTRFRFGRNWRSYAEGIDEADVEKALASIVELTGPLDEKWQTFLDIGCGSGLFSAAATHLGLEVRAFDYDFESVETTRSTLERLAETGVSWHVDRGDILDPEYVARLDSSDIVYAWGVLHHTGDLWKAMKNAAGLVGDGGILIVAIYNDQGRTSQRWKIIKRTYVRYPSLRPFLLGWSFIRLWGRSFLRDTVRRRDPFYSWRQYSGDSRAMSAWHDLVDWVGGYPYEVATPDEVERALNKLGLTVEKSLLIGNGSGNNQFVARRAVKRTTPIANERP